MLVEQIAEATLLRGEVRTLLGWLRALPEPMVQARPRLSLVHAWALVTIEGERLGRSEVVHLTKKTTLLHVPLTAETEERVAKAGFWGRLRAPAEADPQHAELEARLSSVLQVIYLVFNAGYLASSGASLTRAELSEEGVGLVEGRHRGPALVGPAHRNSAATRGGSTRPCACPRARFRQRL